MRLAKGPRPTSIIVFSGAFLGAALLRFLDSYFLPDGLRFLIAHISGWTPGPDAMIVIASAGLSIACIPVAIIWFLAAPIARAFVTVMIIIKLLSPAIAVFWLPEAASPSHADTLNWGLLLVAFRALFWPTSREWFNTRGHEPDAVFD